MADQRGASRIASRPAIAGWVLFDWAAQPYFTLITTFVFAPYFATAVAPNPTEGQALWGYATSTAGLCIALLSPVLGAIADAGGRRKPWIAGFGALLVIGSTLLWYGRPGAPDAILIVMVAYVIATIGVEFATVFNNAMMPSLVPPERLGWLSGTGWATGYVGGLFSLIVVLGLLAANPETGKTLLGITPLFGLDAAAREGDRMAGPLTGVWFIVFVLPLFLFTPDHVALRPLGQAITTGLATLKQTLRGLPAQRNLSRFLIANMIYTDGLVALFAFGGIYTAGTFGWTTIDIGIFGIILTITGAIGAYLGGWLDDRFGPKCVIVGSLLSLLTANVLILLINADNFADLFFYPPPRPNDGLYATVGEKIYVLLGIVIGMAAGPMQAASRTLLVRLAPEDKITQVFGLLALSGKVTSFFGPLFVSLATAYFVSQKAGMAVLIVFFCVGLVLLTRVRTTPDARPAFAAL